MRRLSRVLLVTGTAAAVLGLGKAHAARHGYDFTGSSRFAWSLAYVAMMVAAAYAAGLPDLARTRRSAVGGAVASGAAAAMGVSLLQLVTGSALLPRFVVFGSPMLLTPFAVLCSSLASDGRNHDRRRDRVLVIAAPDEAVRLEAELAAWPERHAVVAEVLSPAQATGGGRGARRVVEAATRTEATAVVLDRIAQADDTIVAQVADLHAAGVRVRTLSLFYEDWLGKLPVSELERVSLMFDIGEIHRARYGRLKRVFDCVLALGGLALLAVVVPVVLVGNAVANRGPVLYRQRRVGKHGRPFEILKFRTMLPDGEGSSWTTDDDPRITRFGAWLRRLHLDELPQVVNVLRGDLSVVGPRPEQPQYVEELSEKLPFYQLRHLVRPGLTGWAQVKYPYGSSQLDALEKLQYEFFYLRRQSLSLDARIVGRTLRSVVGRTGR